MRQIAFHYVIQRRPSICAYNLLKNRFHYQSGFITNLITSEVAHAGSIVFPFDSFIVTASTSNPSSLSSVVV